MSKISDYRLLSFDVYGTLIDWETGIYNAFIPTLAANDATTTISRQAFLRAYQEVEHAQQTKTPDMVYSDLLATCHPILAAKLGLKTPPSADESRAFGAAIGDWQPFPDTIDALQRLGKHYKLVVLSNVDRTSFARTDTGPLADVNFDLILTAQDIGSYKPNPRNFEYMLEQSKAKFGIEKAQVLQTAQSQFHDHYPARRMGIKGVWINRANASIGKMDEGAEEIYDWKFNTLGEMADQLERELSENK